MSESHGNSKEIRSAAVSSPQISYKIAQNLFKDPHFPVPAQISTRLRKAGDFRGPVVPSRLWWRFLRRCFDLRLPLRGRASLELELYVGVIAQEVQAVRPDAVLRDRDGFPSVDYGRLGMRMQTWEKWIAPRW